MGARFLGLDLNLTMGVLALAGGGALAAWTLVGDQDSWLTSPSYAQSESDGKEAKKVKKPEKAVEKAAEKAADKKDAAPVKKDAPVTAQKDGAPAPAAQASDFQVVSQLQAAGVKRCLDMAGGLGRYEMAGVSEYASASTWNKTDPDHRLISAVIGQRYGQGANSTAGVAAVISAPGSEGKCDGVGLQIIPTTATCSAVQAQVLAKGEMLGNLVGVPMMRNAQNQRVMLLPTAGEGCVVVGINNAYVD